MSLSRKPPPCYYPEPLGNLVEIIDAHGNPVCLITTPEAAAQGLAYRSAAVLAHAGGKLFLLREIFSQRFDITVCAPVAAGQTMTECAENLLVAALGQKASLKCLFPQPDAQADAMTGIFGANFSPAMLVAVAPPGYLLADREELLFFNGNKWLEPLASRAASFFL